MTTGETGTAQDAGAGTDVAAPTAGLARSGVAMALGTLASRGTGFLRTVVVAAAIGLQVGDSYNVANTIPNILYDLLLGGVLSSVVIPLLVGAAHDGDDDGEAYAQRLVTMTLVVLTVVAALGVAFAPQVVDVYAHGLHPGQRELATTFARFFLPQVVFYGLGAVFGAILNTRGSFAPPMWAPVLNNLVVIASGALFIVLTHGVPRAQSLGRAPTLTLAIGTTAGIVLQTVALLPFLRRVRFRLRLRFDWRGVGLRSAGAFAAWIIGYVLTNQVGYAVIVNLATAARATSSASTGYSPYTYAFILFSLPYAVVSVSVITALFPQMSRSAAAGDRSAVADSLATGLGLSAVLMVPATVAFVALGPLLATVVFAHVHISVSGARLTGAVLAGFGVGLVPFSAFQLQLRAFLALRDARTPFLVNLAITAVNLLADVVLFLVLPGRWKVVGLAVGFSLSYAVGAAVFAALLRRRVGTARTRRVAQTHVRLAVAALVAALPTYLTARTLSAGLGDSPEPAFVAVVVACLVGGAVFLALARRMRVAELAEVTRMVQGRLRRG